MRKAIKHLNTLFEIDTDVDSEYFEKVRNLVSNVLSEGKDGSPLPVDPKVLLQKSIIALYQLADKYTQIEQSYQELSKKLDLATNMADSMLLKISKAL